MLFWVKTIDSRDPRWRTFAQEFKDFVGFNNKPIGEFFISYKDFIKQFHHVSFCHLETTLYPGQSKDNLGYLSSHHGQWVTGQNAGGSSNYMSSYAKNPQFHVTIEPPKSPDDLYHDGKVLLIVSLMLPDNRGSQKPLPYIGFALYEVNSDKTYIPLTKDYLSVNLPIATSGNYQSRKEIVSRFRVEPAELVIIPTTYYPERDSSFLLRTYSNCPLHVQSFSN